MQWVGKCKTIGFFVALEGWALTFVQSITEQVSDNNDDTFKGGYDKTHIIIPKNRKYVLNEEQCQN